jgi:hypothetical protein
MKIKCVGGVMFGAHQPLMVGLGSIALSNFHINLNAISSTTVDKNTTYLQHKMSAIGSL